MLLPATCLASLPALLLVLAMVILLYRRTRHPPRTAEMSRLTFETFVERNKISLINLAGAEPAEHEFRGRGRGRATRAGNGFHQEQWKYLSIEPADGRTQQPVIQ